MSNILRNESTDTGREMWRAVDRAASRAPEWIRTRVENAPMQNGGWVKRDVSVGMVKEIREEK
jgi:hypothetical protein